MAKHIVGLQGGPQLDTATALPSPTPSHLSHLNGRPPNPTQSRQGSLRSPYSLQSPQTPKYSPTSPRSPQGPTRLPRAQPQSRVQPLKSSVIPTKSRFSDFSVDSEEGRIRALYQRITAAQPISYKSVFVDVEEKEDPRPSGIRLKWWLFELLAWTLSLATLCALVLLLHQYNGKKQSAWPSQLFTLNALVALIATFTRVSLLIPITQALSQAKWDWFSNSRWREVRKGKPLGDLEVFDKASRSAYGGLALLWRLKGRHLPTIGAILMILSLGFDTFSQQLLTIDYRLGDAQKFCGSVPHASAYQDVTSSSGLTSLNVSARAAISNGILSADMAPVQASCPSGDCSWPTTPTIGVCGACIDISKELGVPALSTNSQGQPQLLTIAEGSKLILNSSATGNSTIDMLIADFNIVGGQNQALISPAATECALWFCVQALDVSQTSGVQNTTLMGNWSEASTPSDSSEPYIFTSVPPSFSLGGNPNYTVTKSTLDAYSSYVSSTINGSVSSTSDGYSYSSDAAESIWGSLSALDSWIQRIATSMTNHIRLVGSSAILSSGDKVEIERYDGTAYENEPFIIVRWTWLAFPAGLVLLSLLYLIASIIQASRSGTHIWKSNPLPLLLADIDPSVKMQADRGMNEPGGIARAGGRRRVSLNNEDGRWIFRATDGSPVIR